MRRSCFVGGVAAAVLLLAVAPAHADAADTVAAAADMALGALQRTRRAVVIGPHVGGVIGGEIDGGSVHAVTFGLALYTFEIPSLLDLQQLIAARIRRRVAERVKTIVAAGGSAPTDLEALAREVAADVVAEVRGEAIQPRVFERPRWGVILETAVLRGGGALGRAGVSRGVGPISLGASLGVSRIGGVTTAYVGAEATLRITPIGRAWTPVVELYARFDVGFDDAEHALVWGGGRLVLDLF